MNWEVVINNGKMGVSYSSMLIFIGFLQSYSVKLISVERNYFHIMWIDTALGDKRKEVIE